jgi:hypothetical protein
MKITNWIDVKFKDSTPKEIITKWNELIKYYDIVLDSDGYYYERNRSNRDHLIYACLDLERKFPISFLSKFLTTDELHIISDEGFHHCEIIFDDFK